MENLLRLVDSLKLNELHLAVEKNRLEAVKVLVKNGADVMNTINNGQTPLHIAVGKNYHHITQELFKYKSRGQLRNLVDRRTLDTGMTALHLAAKNNSFESTTFLLSYGANFKIKDKEDKIPEMLTTDDNIKQIFKTINHIFKLTLDEYGYKAAFLEKLNSCPPDNLEAIMYARCSEFNHTALQRAICRERLDPVAEIIHFRIFKLPQNHWQARAEFDKLMQYSKAVRHHLSNLDSFYEKKTDSMIDLEQIWDITKVKKNVLGILQNSFSFLEIFKQQGNVSLTNQASLIIIEESLEVFGTRNGQKFIEYGRVEILLKDLEFTRALLKMCIMAPMQHFMRSVYTLELLKASRKNDLARVIKCLTGYPDVNAFNIDGWAPLHYALNHENDDMTMLLLNHGADPTCKSKNSQLILHVACDLQPRKDCLYGYVSPFAIQFILESVQGEKLTEFINQASDDGMTALHLAAKTSNFRLAEILLSKSAIYCAKNAENLMPQDLCKSHVKLYTLLNLVDQSFAQVRDGQIIELVEALNNLDKSSLLAVGGARNEQSQTLIQVLKLGGYNEKADEIEKLLATEKNNYYKHIDEIARYRPKTASKIYTRLEW